MILHRSRRSRRLRYVPAHLELEVRQLLSADVLTYHNDNARDGVNTNETTLTLANVNSTDFGKTGFLSVDGKVDAQPVIKTGVTIPGQGVHDVVYVATESDSVYAFDANTGTLLWHDGPASLIPGETTVLATDVNCPQIEPTIGITSTPVIDPTTNTIYVVAMSKSVVNGTTTYYQRIHALDLGTGADKVAPRAIDQSITVPGVGAGSVNGVIAFDPKMYAERDALTLSNGVIYTGWTSHCDDPPYTGWIIGINASTLSIQSVLNINPNGTPASTDADGTSGNSFWNSGGGFAVDADGNLYNISGNGPFDPSQGDYGDAYLKLATTAGKLSVADYFAPSNQTYLSNNDIDLGSSGVILLPNMTDASGNVVHLIVGSGKDGNIYVLNQANLGQYNTTANQIVQTLDNAIGGAEFGTPAYYNGAVYFGAVGASIRAFTVTNGLLSTSATSQSANTFVYPGSTVSVSANGNTNGIVWATENGDTAALYAYNAADLSDELYDSNQAADDRDQFGAGNKFITPTIANGHVYVGTTDGVAVFGLLGTYVGDTPPITGPVAAPAPTVLLPAFSTPAIYVAGFDQLGTYGADADFGEPSLTYTWSVVSAPAGAPTPFFTVNGTNASKLVAVAIAAPGPYDFRVTITSPDGQTVTSDETINAVVPAPVLTVPAFAGSTRTLGTTLQLAAGAADPVFLPTDLSYTWSTLSTPKQAKAPVFSANGTSGSYFTAVSNLTKAGTYVFQVRITNPFSQSITSDVTVVIGAKAKAKRG